MKTLRLALILAGAAGQAAAIGAAAEAADRPREFTIPPERQQMIGVTYAPVERKPLRRTIRALGVVAASTGGTWDYVARVDGYVHDLRISSPGENVEKGQTLMDIYSPELVSTEGEYVDLLRMRENGRRERNAAAVANAERLIAGARARLRQWNIADAQIDDLGKSGVGGPYVALASPVRGIVESVAVRQGQHFLVGDSLAVLADLSTVWVWGEFYEYELPLLRPGLSVTITSTSIPGFSRQGTIAVVDPFLDETKRTGRVRIDVDNAEGKLRPGAYVDVALAIDEGDGLTIPCDAVFPTGERNIVFVDKGGGTLEPRFVSLGGRYGDVFHVTAGLKAGERVVASANFLVDSESKVQGALGSR